jgi:hypothetical protein
MFLSSFSFSFRFTACVLVWFFSFNEIITYQKKKKQGNVMVRSRKWNLENLDLYVLIKHCLLLVSFQFFND